MSEERILLLRPPHISRRASQDINPMPPIGLGYLASALRPLTSRIAIYDSLVEYWDAPRKDYDESHELIGPDEDEIGRVVAQARPGVVGLSVMFSNQHALLINTCAAVRKAAPAAKIVVGGAHPTVMPREVLLECSADYVVLGEGESSFCDILRHIRGEFPEDDFDGVGLRRGDEIKIWPKTRFIGDLDSIAFPAWELLGLEKYFSLKFSHGLRHKARFMPLVTSRGCPAKCVFCSAKQVWGGRFRFRSVENVLAELRLLKSKYGVEEIMFEDDNLTADPARAKKLFQAMIDEGFGFVWDTPNGVAAWTLNNDLLDLMLASGCVKLNLAIESGSERVLKDVIRKPLRLDRAARLIEYGRKIGLDVSAFFIFGLPGETFADMDQTFEFVKKHGIKQAHFSLATPYPGSELYDICKKNNYFIKDYLTDKLYLWSYLIETEDWTAGQLQNYLEAKLREVKA